MTPYPRHSDPYAARWKMLALISLGFVAMTLNWFDIAPAFPAIGTEFHTNISRTAFLISLFLLGYGIAHIPGGMLATRIGMKQTLVLGLLLEGLAGMASGLCQNYLELAIVRVVAGIGASVFIAVAFGAPSVRRTLALCPRVESAMAALRGAPTTTGIGSGGSAARSDGAGTCSLTAATRDAGGHRQLKAETVGAVRPACASRADRYPLPRRPVPRRCPPTTADPRPHVRRGRLGQHLAESALPRRS